MHISGRRAVMSAARFSMPEKGGEKMAKTQGEEALGGGLFLSVDGEHRFGLDAFLLARFAAPRRGDRVADLGCGCGIVPFLLWRDFRPARVDGVELQPAAVRLFARSVARSGNPPLYPLEADLRRLEGLLPAGAFDLVTCNPPYFRAGSGPAGASASARLARQEGSCTLEEVCRSAARLLCSGGRFCLCQRPQRLAEVFAALRGAGLEPKRLRLVGGRPGSAPWLVLAEGRKGGRPSLQVEGCLYTQGADGAPNPALNSLYKPL